MRNDIEREKACTANGACHCNTAAGGLRLSTGRDELLLRVEEAAETVEGAGLAEDDCE